MSFDNSLKMLDIPSAMCEAAAGAYMALFENAVDGGEGLPAVRVEPGWPPGYMDVDCTRPFRLCPYAAELFEKLEDRLSGLGTLVTGDKVRVGDPTGNGYSMLDHIPLVRLRPQDYWVNIDVLVHGSRTMPFRYRCIGEVKNPYKDYHQVNSVLIWCTWADGNLHTKFVITGGNPGDRQWDRAEYRGIDEAVDAIAEYSKGFSPIDMSRAGMETAAHYRWLSRRPRNLLDTDIGKKFVERFNELADDTQSFEYKGRSGKQCSRHLAGIYGNGICGWDTYNPAYRLKTTSDGQVALVGEDNADFDYSTILLTDGNWEEVCSDVFREMVSLGRRQRAQAEREANEEKARQARRVMSDRNRIRNAVGEFMYNKFFDVVDDGELEGKTTDEIIKDIRCAIAEDYAEYDTAAKQDRIRNGR